MTPIVSLFGERVTRCRTAALFLRAAKHYFNAPISRAPAHPRKKCVCRRDRRYELCLCARRRDFAASSSFACHACASSPRPLRSCDHDESSARRIRKDTTISPPLTPNQAAALNVCFLRDISCSIEQAGPLGQGIACYTPVGQEDAYDAVLPASFQLIAQREGNFSQRLAGAIEDLLRVGFASVCFGSILDSPTACRHRVSNGPSKFSVSLTTRLFSVHRMMVAIT